MKIMIFLRNVSLVLFMLMFASWTSDRLVTCEINASVYEVDSEFNLRPLSAAQIKYHKESNSFNIRTADEDTNENGQAIFPVTEEHSATIKYFAEKPQYTSSSEIKSIAAGDCTISLNVMNLNELKVFEREIEQQVKEDKHDIAKAKITKMKTYFKDFQKMKAFKNIRQLEMKIEERKIANPNQDLQNSKFDSLDDDTTLPNPLLQNRVNPLINVKPEVLDKVKIKKIDKMDELQEIKYNHRGRQ